MLGQMRNGFFLIVVSALLGAWSAQPGAQTFPSRPIKILVPYPAGGASDLMVRAIAQKMGAVLGQPVIVDYRPGAGGRIGTEATSKAAPDGYTIGFVATTQLAVAPSVYRSLAYDPVKSFEPLILLAHAPYLATVTASVPAKTLRELVALDRRDPGRLNFASFGPGSMLQFAGENFNAVTGTRLVHVPYKGSAQALVALLAGEAQVMFDQLASFQLANFQSGKLKALAVLAPARLAQLPDVPTAAEAGFPELEGNIWFALIVPAGTPRQIVLQLNDATRNALAAREVVDLLVHQNAMVIDGGPPEQLAAIIRDDTAKWSRIIKASGFKPE